MIRTLWLQLFAILFLVSAPILGLETLQRREILTLVSQVESGTDIEERLTRHREVLKQLAQHEPAREEELRREFEKSSEALAARQDMGAVRGEIFGDIERQVIRNSLLLLLVCLAISFALSKRIVAQFQTLMNRKVQDSLKLEKLQALDNWQQVARNLVHELRAPITPIKLTATGLVTKSATLPPEAFQTYIGQASELIVSQVSVIERMIEHFTAFARLPAPDRKPLLLSDFVTSMHKSYANLAPQLTFISMPPSFPKGADEVSADFSLLQRLVFNLLRNALEANGEKPLTFRLGTEIRPDRTVLLIENDGVPIPPNVVERLFDPRVNMGDHAQKMGLGLAISRKIALEHGGDLELIHNDTVHGVAFALHFPRCRTTPSFTSF